MEKRAITFTNLRPYVGRRASISCTVGVVIDRIAGRLTDQAGLCWYAVELPDGKRICFSAGQFAVDMDDTIIIHIS